MPVTMTVAFYQAVFGILLGLLIAIFHRPIGDFMLEQERALDFMFRSRGVKLPPPPTQAAARDIYFLIGIAVALIEVGRLWIVIH
jgi:hypothetical protein